MQDTSLHKVSDLPDWQKAAIEALLGRTLSAEEHVSVIALAPDSMISDQDRIEARRQLASMLRERAEEPEADEAEVDEAIEEAMRHVRPSYRSRS